MKKLIFIFLLSGAWVQAFAQICIKGCCASCNLTAQFSVVDDICASNDGEILITPTGGSTPYFYDWTGSPYAIPNTNNPIGYPADNTYQVVVSDANNCTVALSNIAIGSSATGLPLGITPIGQITADCDCTIGAGSIAMRVAGGNPPYVATWINDATGTVLEVDNIANQNGSASILGVCGGVVVRVNVEDSQGCMATQSYTIQDNCGACNLAITNANITPTCTWEADGIIEVIHTGGTAPYSYNWSPPFPASSTNIVSGIGQGGATYEVTITDATGCSVVGGSYVVPTLPQGDGNNPDFTFGGGQNHTCIQQLDGFRVVNIVGTEGPYTYEWYVSNDGHATYTFHSTNATLQNYPLDINGIKLCTTNKHGCTFCNTAGATPPTNNCNNSLTVDINCGTSGTQIALTASASGGSGTITSYSWSSSQGDTGSTQTITTPYSCSGNTTAIYTVTVTDSNGDTATDTRSATSCCS